MSKLDRRKKGLSLNLNIRFIKITRKNSFAEVSKSLTRYRSESNFVRLSKYCNVIM